MRGDKIISSYTKNVADVCRIESIHDTLMEKIAEKVAELNKWIMDCLTVQDDIDKEESSTEEMMMSMDELLFF